MRFAASLGLLLAVGTTASGCSFSYQLGSLFGKEDEKPAAVSPAPEITNGTRASPAAAKFDDANVADTDIAAAGAAAARMMAAGSKGISQPWENPATGSRGMITPLATARDEDGFTCRDFLASLVRGEAEAWLQGEACRVHRGQWVVRSLKPWKRA
jgi:surface antigen